jgi:UDP-glucose 4-epimerase
LLDAAVKDADRIYHLAAVVGVKHVLENPVRLIAVNQSATERLLKVMAAQHSTAPVMIASSSEVYGFDRREKFSEDDDLVIPSKDRLRWCYAVTKLADEMLAFAYHHQYGVRTITARLFNAIGRRQSARYGMVVPHFVAQALAGAPLTIYGDGHQSRSFCDVRDTVRMLEALAASEKAVGQVVNVGHDREIPIEKLALLIKERAGSPSPLQHVSYADAYGLDFYDIRHRRPDLSRLEALTKLKAKFTLEDTIDDLLMFFRKKDHRAGA